MKTDRVDVQMLLRTLIAWCRGERHVWSVVRIPSIDEEDLRRQPLQMRKSTLDVLLSRRVVGLRFNQHIEEDGPIVFEHACKLHLEGIVSKRKESTFRGAQRIG